MKKEKKKYKHGIINGGITLLVTCLNSISSIIIKCSNKMYKKSLKNKLIDFDNLGPEIVHTEEENGEKNNEY